MPRYYFDVIDGEEMVDDIGTVLPDAQTMRQEATRFIASLLSEEPIRRDLGQVWTLRVRVDHGATVLTIKVQD